MEALEQEQEQVRKEPKRWHNVEIKGQWLLTYTVKNSQGATAFGGYQLSPYANPFTGEKTFLRNVDRQAFTGYMIDRLVKRLDPSNNENDRLVISWLICHPEVEVVGVKNLDKVILAKKAATSIKLTYSDYQEVDRLEEEDYIDKLVGVISFDAGKNALSTSKLRYILAYLNMTYRDPRFEDESSEKKALRSRLKSYARKSMECAKEIYRAIDNINDAQDVYEFKEMVRTKVLTMEHSIYKFRRTPIGSNFETVNVFFQNHPEVKTEACSELYEKLI